MVPIYLSPEIQQLQHLRTIEPYAYDSFQSHPGRMSRNISLLYVHRLPYAARERMSHILYIRRSLDCPDKLG